MFKLISESKLLKLNSFLMIKKIVDKKIFNPVSKHKILTKTKNKPLFRILFINPDFYSLLNYL